MSTVSTAIQLQDRVSAPIRNIISAIESVCSAFESVEQSMDGGFDASAIDSARAALSEAVVEADRLGDEIEQNVRNQDKFNEEVEEGVRSADGLTNSILGMVGAYASFQGGQKLFDLSDTAVQTTARLKFIVDDENTVESLEEKIMASAQRSRASYQTTADAVAKLGMQAEKAFGSNDELIAFTELLNKSFVVAGTEAQGVESVMLQMTQAMAAGKLQGEELNAILDNAQPIVANIQKYLEEVQNIDASNIKELASEGKITADVIKNAMFYAAEDINTQFESMPMTWSQVWTGVMNELYMASVPVLEMISLLAQNWEILEPIVIGLAVAVGLYTGALLLNNAITAISATLKATHAAAEMMATGATFAATAAQYGFNAALFACPLTWIIMLLIAVIAIIYAVVGAINKLTGSSISATGVIVGALLTAVAFIWNLFLGLVDFVLGIVNFWYNLFGTFINFFANIFNDPIGSIIHLFGDLADAVLGVLETIAKAIDKVFGSNLAGSVQGWRNGLDEMIEKAANKHGNGSYEKVMENLNMDSATLGLKRWEYGDAYDTGYEWGANLGKSAEEDKLDEILEGMEGVNGNTAEIADNTKGLSDTQEDLAYLRDIAERDIINRYTTAEIKIEQTNNNSIASDMDIDGIMDKWNADFTEILETAAEGVHA